MAACRFPTTWALAPARSHVTTWHTTQTDRWCPQRLAVGRGSGRWPWVKRLRDRQAGAEGRGARFRGQSLRGVGMMGNGAPSANVPVWSAALALTAQFMLFPSLAESLGIDPILISTLHGSLTVKAQDSRPSRSLLHSRKALSSSASCWFIREHKDHKITKCIGA